MTDLFFKKLPNLLSTKKLFDRKNNCAEGRLAENSFDRNFRSIEYHHAFYLNIGTLAGLWPWAIVPSLKIESLGFFHHHHTISDS
jgi:hypothetical protein